MQGEWLAAARSGDQVAFARLVEPHRRELQVYCYRMLGSLLDAEDLVQETLLRAWRRLDTFEGRASLRAWLYRIATNACLDDLRRRPRRTLPQVSVPPADPAEPLAPPPAEPIWLEPLPDEWLAGEEASPEAAFDRLESVTFAFLIALQALPPRQRAVLILKDVLAWRAREVAALLDLTVPAVNSALHRARVTLAAHYHGKRQDAVRLTPGDPRTSMLLQRYVQAWERADVEGIVALLKEDAAYPMPPSPSWYRGRAAIGAFIRNAILSGADGADDASVSADLWLLRPAPFANGCPAVAWYRRFRDARAGGSERYQAFALQVLSWDGELLAEVMTFVRPELFPFFGLPPQLLRSG
jgi:RNA polymerase sigma-70 factor (ECF subfamily)